MAGGIVAQELEVLGQFIKSLGDGERLDTGYDGELNIYWDSTNLVVRMQVYSATKPGWEAFDPTEYLDAVYAPSDVNYLVGTADPDLSAEIEVGTTPGGELGNTWSSPTVDTIHAEGAHSAMIETHRTTATAHHSNVNDHLEAHTVASAGTHTESGLTVGHVLRASGATAFGFAAIESGDIDGDQLDIDWDPTNYDPATTPTEVTSLDHLTAHLYGIDQAIGSAGVTIKSRQAGTAYVSSGAQTITAVTVASCQLSNLGSEGVTVNYSPATTSASVGNVRIHLTSTTSVTPYDAISAYVNQRYGYEVLEWQ